MTNWILLLIAVIAVVVWVIWFLSEPRARAQPSSVARGKTAGGTSMFHAVSIRSGLEPCEAVNKLKGERLLSKNAPSLPLPACEAADCQCWYEHFADRRLDDRRSYRPTNYADQERRAGNDRRHIEMRLAS
jgi:hypothetical protein